MKSAPLILTLGAAAALSACQTVDEGGSDRIAQATLRLANGAPAGTALLLSTPTGVTVTISATGIAPGLHGVHLHTTGSCEAPDFTSAGGHLNPGGRQHGTDNPAGAHLGDIPNLTAGPGGNGTVSAALHGPTPEVLGHIFDGDGTAIVIHAGPDDYRTDPAGDSGARIACGVFTRL